MNGWQVQYFHQKNIFNLTRRPTVSRQTDAGADLVRGEGVSTEAPEQSEVSEASKKAGISKL